MAIVVFVPITSVLASLFHFCREKANDHQSIYVQLVKMLHFSKKYQVSEQETVNKQ
jgi:uncharacterized membrane protein